MTTPSNPDVDGIEKVEHDGMPNEGHEKQLHKGHDEESVNREEKDEK